MNDTKIAYLISFACLALAAGVQWWRPSYGSKLHWLNRFTLLAATGLALWRLVE